MGGDERRAEVEAGIVTLLICRRSGALTQDCPSPNYACENGCDEEEVQYVRLDRLRDARGDDEVVPLSAEDDERHARWELEQSRSPQGEDHEALYETVRIAAVESSDVWLRTRAQEVLSRVSPSRDGTVAVDHEQLRREVEQLRAHDDERVELAQEVGKLRAEVARLRGGTVAVEDVATIVIEALEHYRRWTFAIPVTPKTLEKRAEVDAALAEFARPATGEQTDHGGDQ